MKYRLAHLIFMLVLLLNGINSYSQSWVLLDDFKENRALTISVIKSDTSIHKVKMTIHGFRDHIISIDGKEYHKIFMDEKSWLTRVGEPQLPIITQSIAIPEGASYEISVIEEKWKDVEIGTIFPAQEIHKEGDPVPTFIIDEDKYRQKEYSPFIVSKGWEQNWRHIRNVNFSICPFKYYPKEKNLSVLTEFILQVKFVGTNNKSIVKSDDLKDANRWHIFDNDINIFPVESHQNNRYSSDYDYLIIVGNLPSIQNSQTLQDFTKWKAFKGYKTKVVSTSTIGATTSAIKNYITQEYYNNGIKYVLFIGDQDKIPLKHIYNIVYNDTLKSDYWYGCIEGGENDYYAEIPVGRFSTNSLSDFQNIVNKTISYEKSYNGNYKKTLLVAHKEGAPEKYQGCCSDIKTSYNTDLSFSTAYGASADPNIGGDDAQNTDVINYINSGMHIVNYRGHGEFDSWGFVSNIPSRNGWNTSCEVFQSNLANYINTCSIYFNVCCLTGDIEQEPCFMEVFTRSPYCAIACLATTEATYTLSNHMFDKELFSKLLNDNVWQIGNLNIAAHISTINSSQSSEVNKKRAIFNTLSYLCGGDPSLEIWTDTPCSYSNVSFMRFGNNMTVNSSSFNSNDKVFVVSESGNVLGEYNVSGNTCTFPLPSESFYVSINRHNYYPFIIKISPTEYIQNQTIDDVCYYLTPLSIGYDVTNMVPYGNVLIESGSKLTIFNGAGGVTIKNGFECELGAEFVVE